MADKKETKVNPKLETKAEVTTGGKETMKDTKATKVAAPKKLEITTELTTGGKETMNDKKVDPKPEAKVAAPTTDGNGTMKLQELKPIELSAAKFKALDAKGLHAEMCTKPQNRISRERGKELLVERIADGKINSITPEAMMDWTYKAVTIDGVTIDGQGFTPATAKKTLTKAEFTKLDAKGKAALIKEFTHKRRASDVIIPELILKGLPLTGEDVVYLTCGRILIDGVTIAAKAKQVHAITEGIKFS